MRGFTADDETNEGKASLVPFLFLPGRSELQCDITQLAAHEFAMMLQTYVEKGGRFVSL
jgi:hypothetical protein